MTPAEFWELTPAETYEYIDARAEYERSEQIGRVWLAYHTAGFHRSRRMPSWASLMRRYGVRQYQRMNRDEFISTVEKLNRAFGGEDRRKKAKEN